MELANSVVTLIGNLRMRSYPDLPDRTDLRDPLHASNQAVGQGRIRT